MKFFQVSGSSMSGELNVSLLFDGEVDCDKSRALLEGKLVVDQLPGIVNSGTKSTYDSASNSCVAPRLFSQKCFDVLESIGSTGYRRVPVVLKTMRGESIDGFSVISITGKSGKIDWSKSEPTMRPPRFKGGRETLAFKGCFFDESEWDGSDIFVPDDTLFIVVTERVALALKKAKLKNVELTPMDERLSDLTSDKIVEAFGDQRYLEWKNEGLI